MPRTLLSFYPRPQDRYDELLAAGGQVRAHWQPLLDFLDGSSPEEMRARRDFVSERIQENGTTYNVYADPKGVDRPWELDPVPNVIGSEDWANIERGLLERAELFNLMLRDFYGQDPAHRPHHRQHPWS